MCVVDWYVASFWLCVVDWYVASRWLYVVDWYVASCWLCVVDWYVASCWLCVVDWYVASCRLWSCGFITEIINTILKHMYCIQTLALVTPLHGLLNCETGGLGCLVITTEHRTRVYCIHM